MASLVIIYGCATTNGPRIGMTFKQPYPSHFGGGEHDGLDLEVPLKTPVRSVADGFVSIATTYNIRGNVTNIIIISHNGGYLSKYVHIDNVKVQRGDEVKRGQVIALTALNGPGGPNTNMRVPYPHLHLEVYKDSSLIDPEIMKMSCSETGWLWPVGCKINTQN